MISIILLPVIAGILVKLIKFKERKHMMIFLELLVVITSILVWYFIFNNTGKPFFIASFANNLNLVLKIDGLSIVFAGLVSFLWPLATLYAFEYMTKEENEDTFFMFYTITYGVTLGIATASNIITMYFFYELLTLVTVPLVMHTLTREAILAGRKYLYYSLGGAAFAFIGVMFIMIYSNMSSFKLGGIINYSALGINKNIFLFIFVMAFLGFSVKAAVCPFNSWLPDAGVAPTPVTALLHAVAVVKSGAFATIRLTYYCIGADFVRGTWAQYLLMAIILFTILYGSSMAVRETHFKRRLAYSTISNLSYILFGVIILTPAGMIGALAHLVFHAFMKISSFFCAGAVMHETDKHYIHELNGLSKVMPATFAVFTVSSFGLMGVPFLAGFISKWYLASAAVESGNVLAYAGIAVLLISALLTAVYMLSVVVRGYFPGKDFDYSTVEKYKDPNWMMIVPLFIFTVAIFVFGLYSEPLITFLEKVATGVI